MTVLWAGLARAVLPNPFGMTSSKIRFCRCTPITRRARLRHASWRGDVPGAKQLAQAPLPSFSDANLRERTRARLLMAAAEYADTVDSLNRFCKAAPSDADVWFELGGALARLGRKEAAKVQAQWLQDNLPADNLDGQLALLRLWQRIGDVERANTLAERLLREVEPRALVPHQCAQPATVLSASLLKRFPTDGEVLLAVARLERSQGRYAQAVSLFKQALEN